MKIAKKGCFGQKAQNFKLKTVYKKMVFLEFGFEPLILFYKLPAVYNMKGPANSADIFMLIKGLSSNEKSYYTKLAKRHSDKNASLHLKLFKLIDESEVHDEKMLSLALGIKNKIHFSGIKNYLYKDILNTIIFKEKNKTADTQLYFLHDQIRMLYERGLVHLAFKLCGKAISLAEKYGKYYFMILFIHLRNRVLENKDYKQFKDQSEMLFAELEEAINEQKIFAQHRLMYEKVRNMTSRSWLPITEDELIEIKAAESLLESYDIGKIQKPLIRLFFFNSLALCQYMLHENSACSETCGRIAELWKSNPHLINENAALFTSSFNTLCYNNFIFKNIDEIRADLNAYKLLKESHLVNRFYLKHFKIIQFNTELKIHLKTARYHEVEKLISSEVEDIFNFTTEILSPPEQLSVFSSVCISYFVLEKWDDAEKLLMNIKEQNHQIKREDVLYFSLLFHLLILYEQGELIRLDSALQAAYQFLYSRKKPRPFERQLMLFLKRLSGTISKRTSKALIAQFLVQLDKYRNDPGTDLYFLYFNYYGWLESKIMGISYKEYVSQKLSRAGSSKI